MTDPVDPAQRLQRLEEGQAFSDHAVEQLGAEVALLGRRLSEALAVLRRLEARLDALSRQGQEAPCEDD